MFRMVRIKPYILPTPYGDRGPIYLYILFSLFYFSRQKRRFGKDE